jgi:hypothetical protein
VPELPSSAHRPILIVGANGTGTTLLRLMLDSHENIAIPPETGFLRLAAAHRWVPYWELGGQWSASLDLGEHDVWQRLADFYGGLFASYAENRGKGRWGDKTPFHVWHLPLAAQMYPELQVVGIVRHPGAVVTSLRRRFRRSLGRSTRHWKRSTKVLLQHAADLGDRSVVIRYEDLVRDPEAVMRPLLDWLGEPWSERVLAHHEVQQSAGTAAEAEGFTRTDAPIDSSNVGTWAGQLQEQALTTLVARTGELARFLGYDPAHGEPVEALAASSPFLTGSQIRERMTSRVSAIDWSRQLKPPAADRPLRPPSPPRRRKRRPSMTLDDVKLGELLRHRAIGVAHRTLPDETRHRANKVRRKRPLLDRLLGPR